VTRGEEEVFLGPLIYFNAFSSAIMSDQKTQDMDDLMTIASEAGLQKGLCPS